MQPTSHQDNSIGPKEKLTVLLKEYDSLRAEVLARTNHIYQLFAIAGGAATWLLSRSIDGRFWLLMCGLATVVLAGWWTSVRDIKKCATRIGELETKVNELVGEDLLQWEKYFGGEATGFFTTKPLKRPTSN